MYLKFPSQSIFKRKLWDTSGLNLIEKQGGFANGVAISDSSAIRVKVVLNL
jgi:hypothetical protein